MVEQKQNNKNVNDKLALPKEWITTSIKELIDNNIIEKPLDGNHGNIHPKSTDYVSNGIPFIMANDVDEGVVNLKSCKFISKLQADKLKKGFSRVDDILLTHKGTVGNTAIVPKLNSDYIVLTPQVTYYRVKNEEKIYNKYIKAYFDSNYFQNILKNLSGGGTRAYIGIVKQQQLPFILPNIEEQKHIGDSISQVNELILSIEKLISKKRLIKQGVMKELLEGKRKLKKFNSPWIKIKLGDISDIKTGSRNNEDKSSKGNYPFFVRSSQIERIDSYSYDGEAILIPGEGKIGEIIHYIKGKFDYHQRVYKISDFKHEYDGKFIYYMMVMGFGNHAMKNSVKATVDSLRLPTFQNFEMCVPSDIEEQKTIVNILFDIDEELKVLQQKLDKYNSIKNGMMEELLTGKRRLI